MRGFGGGTLLTRSNGALGDQNPPPEPQVLGIPPWPQQSATEADNASGISVHNMDPVLTKLQHLPPAIIIMSRRPFSIAELAARSRPTGYDPSRSLKDLLRTATAERNAGDAAKEAGDVESAFIHYAKASTLMLEELPTHPKFGELNTTQKDAVLVVRTYSFWADGVLMA